MVASAALSAVAFFYATTFSDRSTELSNQARFAAADESRRRSALNATVVHDQRVVLGCLASIQARDAALTEFSRRFDEESIAAVVESEQRRNALDALLISNGAGCGEYRVEAALEQERLFGRQSGDANWPALLARSGRYAAAEPLSVVAAVLFAVVLLLLTLADSSLQRRWVRAWLGLSMVVAVVAAALAAAALWTAGEVSGDAFALVAAIVVMLSVLLWLTATTTAPAWILSRVGRHRIDELRVRPGPLQAMRREVRWWAEVLGAVTLVVFAVAALGFSLSATRQRDAVVAADRYTLQAREALELGEQSALAVLGYVSELAEIDAATAARSGATPVGAEAPPSEANEDLARQTVLDRWETEKHDWEQLLDASARGAGGGVDAKLPARDAARAVAVRCFGDDDVLVWRQGGDAPNAPLPVTIRVKARTEPGALSDLVNRGLTGAVQCSTRAALSWHEARGWGDRSAHFTVALVILGLGGFLFALAADPDRTIRPRRWLLGSAMTGLAAGLLLTSAGWFSEPRPGDEDQQRQAAAAYARGETAARELDCSTAREAAAEVTTRLPDFPRAHILESTAWACTEDAGWLIAPAMSGPRLERFQASLERALAAGMRGGTVAANLGWAHLLAGALGRDEDRSEQLERGVALTTAALRDDPTNPFLCFNAAFGELARRNETVARETYRNALAAIEGKPVPGASCLAEELDPLLQDLVRLSALADLELLPEAEHLDGYRELIVSGSTNSTGPADADLTGLSMETYPQEIAIAAEEGAALEHHELAIVWYHRSSDDDAWAVVTGPSLSTIRPGHHIGVWRLDRPLAAGQYRADLFVGDGFAGRLVTQDHWWASHSLAANDFRRVELTDVGVSAIIPDDWELIAEERGVEVTYGSGTESVSFRRSEGDSADGLEDRLRAWSGEDWDHSAGGGEAAWYLGLDTTVVRQLDAGTWVGAGHDQYVTAPTGAFALSGEVEDPSCPGTTIMTRVAATDAEVAETIWNSQVLITPPPTVPVDKVALTSPFTSSFFSIGFPDGWAATACPENFVAGAPDRSQNVIVGSEEFDGSTTEYFEQSTAAYSEEFENFKIERQESVVLANGVLAEQLTYTWTSEGAAIRQIQTFAVTEGLGYVMTITHTLDEELPAATADLLLGSFRPGRTATIVPAVCDGCTASEREERQAAVDRIAQEIAVIDDLYCNDTTDSFDSDALARIGCSLPGGFHVDFALWPDDDAVVKFADLFRATPGATVNDWFLYGDDTPKTGITVEWVEDADARFFWTWDDRLLTGNAMLVGGDPERLNAWWQTTGALVRE